MSRSSLKSPLLVLAGALCFSSTGFTQALIASEGSTPLAIAALRMLVGGLSLLLMLWATGKLPSRHDWPWKNVLLCTIGIAGFQVLFFSGVLRVGVAIGTVIASGTTPIAAALIGAIFLHEAPVRAWYPSTALAIAGIVAMNWASTGTADVSFVDLLFPIAAGSCYGITLTASKPLLRKHAPEAVMTVLLLCCAAALSPLLLTEPLGFLLTGKGMLAALHLGVITTALGYTLTLAGLQQTKSSTAATLGLAEPLGAAFFGFVCLSEPLTMSNGIGILLIIGSALLLIFMPSQSLPPRSKS